MGDQTRGELREAGLAIRREVLGDEYVNAAMNNVTDFNRPLQELLNEYCWGACWGREGLTRRERSMINIAMLTALGRMPEVETHVRGALNNGVTPREITEILLQTAVYCGVPAAVDSFRAAGRVLAEDGR